MTRGKAKNCDYHADEKEKLKEKIGIGLKYRGGILLAAYTRERFVRKMEYMYDMGNVNMHVDYEDMKKLYGKSGYFWKANVSVPTKAEEVEIKILITFDRYSAPREKYLERKLAFIVSAEREEVQRELEGIVGCASGDLRQTYDTPPGTNMVAVTVGKHVSEKKEDDNTVPTHAVILAGQDGRLITVSGEGKVTKDSPYAIAGKSEWTDTVRKTVDRLYKDDITLEDAKKIVKAAVKELDNGRLEFATVTEEEVQKC